MQITLSKEEPQPQAVQRQLWLAIYLHVIPLGKQVTIAVNLYACLPLLFTPHVKQFIAFYLM